MFKRLLLFILCAGLLCVEADATSSCKEKKKKRQELIPVSASSDQGKSVNYSQLFSEKCETQKGLITLHKTGKKLYFEIPLSLLNKDMLLASTVSGISDNGDALVGQKPTEPLHIRFTRVDSAIQLRQIFRYSVTRQEDTNIEQALRNSNIGAVLGSYKIEAYSPDSLAVVIEISDFFMNPNKSIEPIDPYSANTYGGHFTRRVSLESNKSFLGEIKAFKDNVVIRSHLTYKSTIASGEGIIEQDKPLTVIAARSIILLPETPARPRIADPRIGIFPTGKIQYTNTDNRAKTLCYANRWRLQPSDMEAYKRGELVQPVQPVIFYIDNNFPEMWKKYLKMGIEDWNIAFEKIGFKNAVRTLPFPAKEQDPEFDPDNIKYSCIRYAPTWMANAMGPSWTDPRTGEIISASVYIYHNLVSLLYCWRFIQTAAADPDVRVPVLPAEIMGDAIRYVTRHEVGHCFGFMHNMAASASVPVEKLRDPEYTREHGITSSIMDYARNNYVAQPGDKEKGVKLTPPVLGNYDYYLVKWNYTPVPEAETPEEESETLNRWISEKAGDPVYRYGKQQVYTFYDPSSVEEDLGDDAVKASGYGIKNLKYILSNLNEWFKGTDRDYSLRFTLYNEVVQQYVRYINHVYFNIGGIYLTERYAGDPTPSYQSVPGEKQREALHFLMKQVKDLDWLEDAELLENFSLIGSPVNDVQAEIISRVIFDGVTRLPMCVAKAKKDPYTPETYLNEVYAFIWDATLKGKKLSGSDRKLQSSFVESLVSGKSAATDVVGTRIGIATRGIRVPEYVAAKSTRDFGFNTQHSFMAIENMKRGVYPGETSGFDFQNQLVYDAELTLNHLHHALLIKTRRLLEKNVNHPSPETRNHYQLLLRSVNKALK